MKIKYIARALCAGLLVTVAACQSGGSGTAANSPSGAVVGAVSSGAISAFGSVFVNGHEFYTVGAKVIDDDTGGTSTSTAGLEVGEVVGVVPAGNSTASHPVAAELHVDPLVRGYVDAFDSTAGTLTVMGQAVQVTSDTVFSDHRACASAATSPCAAIVDLSGLSATSGSGSGAVPGTYVSVHGYLFGAGASAGTADIVATLVAVGDTPSTAPGGDPFKAEGIATAADNALLTIGGLSIDLTNARCFSSAGDAACSGAFSAGQVVSVYGATAPSLPAGAFAADAARLNARLSARTAGSSVEIEGAVSSVTDMPAAFVLRGIHVDATGLPAGTALPVTGDVVRVLGTVGSDGLSIIATSVTVLHVSRSASYGLEGDLGNVAAGSAANTYVVTILGQDVTVTGNTRLADRSVREWEHQDPTVNPFNIDTFPTYLAASASQHVVVYAQSDASGNLTAQWLTIMPASTATGIAGAVDADPAPVNSSGAGTPTTFSVHGLPVSADAAAIRHGRRGAATTVAAGDQVIVYGSLVSGTLTVTAPAGAANEVIDSGMPMRRDLNEF